MIKTYSAAVTTTGSAGSASGSTIQQCTPPINGFYLGAYYDFHASAPGATTDTTIQFHGGGNPSFVLTNSATDGFRPSRIQAALNTDGSAISGVYEMHPIDASGFTVSLAQCDALTNAVVVYIFVLET